MRSDSSIIELATHMLTNHDAAYRHRRTSFDATVREARDAMLSPILASARIPRQIDNIAGLIYVRDLCNAGPKAVEDAIEPLLRPAYFVRRRSPRELLAEMQKPHVQLAASLTSTAGSPDWTLRIWKTSSARSKMRHRRRRHRRVRRSG